MNRKARHTTLALFTGIAATGLIAVAGDLNPPAGPVAPTMKTLAEVEPRIAINATNTPGDASSVYRIATRGTYYLTGAVAGASGKNGITIAANNVTLDLNGFDLNGVAGSLAGVSIGAGLTNCTVVNGIVRNWGARGIDASSAYSTRIESVDASSNAGDGIASGANALVRDCRVRLNALTGIGAASDCVVEGCTAESNTGSGISVGTGCTITRCAAGANQVNGIFAIQGCTVSHCAARSNGDDGIEVGTGCGVSQCTASFNVGDGIECGNSNLVEQNVCMSNGNTADGAGVHAIGIGNRIIGNVCQLADRGLDLSGSFNHIADNTVFNNADNYDIASGNQVNLLLGQLPESIDWPATVKLAGDLTGPSGSNGITIAADNVTIDLDGHALVGAGGALDGINVSGSRRNIVIRNGTVRDWPGDGIDLSFANHSKLQELIANSNGANGLQLGNNSAGQNCIATYNAADGINVGANSMLSACVSTWNGASGIYVASFCRVSECVVNSNAVDGIRVYFNSELVDNTCLGNGITSGNGAAIHAISSFNHIRGNYCTGSPRGLDLDSSDNEVADNSVHGNTDNYDIAAGNQLNILLGQLPESIDWPATVKLAGDLTGVSGSNGVTIAADNVTIDLDGHALVGASGALDGINVSGSRRNIAIRNGTARNWGGDGIDAANAGNSQFDRLQLSNNTGDGLRAGVDCAIHACAALANGGDGIEGGGNGTILECFSNANTLTGILAGDSTIVANCEAAFNSTDGIRVGTASTVRHCIVRGSTGDGIEAGTSCTIADNHADLNGNGAGSGAGVHVTGTGNRVEGNTCLAADRGIDVDSTGNLIIRNTARSNTTNYDIVAGNRYGPVIDITAGGTAAVSGNSAASTMSSTDPWANFAH